MPITTHQTTGSITIDGDDAMKLYRMLTLKSGLKLELLGMRMTRGKTCYARIKEEFGLKGTKQRVAEQFEALVAEQNSRVIRVQE